MGDQIKVGEFEVIQSSKKYKVLYYLVIASSFNRECSSIAFLRNTSDKVSTTGIKFLFRIYPSSSGSKLISWIAYQFSDGYITVDEQKRKILKTFNFSG